MPMSRIIGPFSPNWFPKPTFVVGEVQEADPTAYKRTTVLSYTVPYGKKAHLILVRIGAMSSDWYIEVKINGNKVYEFQAYPWERDTQYYTCCGGTRGFPLAYITADGGETIEVAIYPTLNFSYGVGATAMLAVW